MSTREVSATELEPGDLILTFTLADDVSAKGWIVASPEAVIESAGAVGIVLQRRLHDKHGAVNLWRGTDYPAGAVFVVERA